MSSRGKEKRKREGIKQDFATYLHASLRARRTKPASAFEDFRRPGRLDQCFGDFVSAKRVTAGTWSDTVAGTNVPYCPTAALTRPRQWPRGLCCDADPILSYPELFRTGIIQRFEKRCGPLPNNPHLRRRLFTGLHVVPRDFHVFLDICRIEFSLLDPQHSQTLKRAQSKWRRKTCPSSDMVGDGHLPCKV